MAAGLAPSKELQQQLHKPPCTKCSTHVYCIYFARNVENFACATCNENSCEPVFSPGFFEGVVGGGAGIRARRWEK